MLIILSKQNDQTITLCFIEEPTANYLNDLLQQSYSLLDQYDAYQEVVIDMEKVNYIDSTGITYLIGLYKNLVRKNKKMRIKGARKEIRELFNIVNLTELFQVEA